MDMDSSRHDIHPGMKMCRMCALNASSNSLTRKNLSRYVGGGERVKQRASLISSNLCPVM
eukprot:5539171-Ditylum_brightwellii.AAC.1